MIDYCDLTAVQQHIYLDHEFVSRAFVPDRDHTLYLRPPLMRITRCLLLSGPVGTFALCRSLHGRRTTIISVWPSSTRVMDIIYTTHTGTGQ